MSAAMLCHGKATSFVFDQARPFMFVEFWARLLVISTSTVQCLEGKESVASVVLFDVNTRQLNILVYACKCFGVIHPRVHTAHR